MPAQHAHAAHRRSLAADCQRSAGRRPAGRGLPHVLLAGTAAALLLLTFPLAAHAQGQAQAASQPSADPGAAPGERAKVQYDRQDFTATLTIPARDGSVSWGDIAQGLAQARGYEDSLLEGLPSASIPLDSLLTRGQLLLYNRLFQPHLEFQVQRDDAGNAAALTVRLDRVAVLGSKRRFKNWFRAQFSREQGPAARGLQWDPAWKDTPLAEAWSVMPAELPAVVFIHGFQSRADSLQLLMATPRKAGYACGSFEYPNDQPIDQSAQALSTALKKFAADHRRPLVLVTHSMGGLVARRMVEDPLLDPGNVRRLVMLAPPNQGSLLAHLEFGVDFAEYVTSPQRRSDARYLAGAIEDGLGEATRDLQPDSVFLAQLKRRPRNPRVGYTVILGDQGPLENADLAKLRGSVADAGDTHLWVRFFGKPVVAWLDDLDEVLDGAGDGAVAIKRGRLSGVEDTHIFHFNHLNVLGEPTGEIQRVHQLMLNRIADAPQPPAK